MRLSIGTRVNALSKVLDRQPVLSVVGVGHANIEEHEGVVGAFGQLAEQPPGDQTVLGDGPRDGLSVFLANEATVVAQASGPKDPICNGADHDGSGTVGIVELADAVAQTGAQHRHEVAAIPASYEKVVETPTQVP